ncbi:hypothetical protein E6P70_10245 [Moraxella nonliquefaciens]|uniref:ParB/RepB/Spo0J family partition protein n=1 Tax=Moraxella nonliquefaciens TaxID=478 RepID=UPI0024A661A2|nr:ParB/RepB/Spo0J family partition protein [Moraxella nonliquefaciens]MDI4498986.1 hypothetical protein [Moraxella nonliquefaciens]MDI4500957.1 hypothetical protein [Moraxella nonliquefaciens]
MQIELNSIDANPYQPRSEFDQVKLEELAHSISELGLLEKTHIDCIITNIDDDSNALLALAENLTREDLSDYEVAKAILTFEQNFPNRKNFAQILGISRQALYRYLSYAKLPNIIIKQLEKTPSLISAPLAENLAQFIKEYKEKVGRGGDESLNTALELALVELLQKNIKQNELIATTKKLLNNKPAKTSEPKTLRIFEVNGKKVWVCCPPI